MKRITGTRRVCAAWICILVVLIPRFVHAQSVYLPYGTSGVILQSESTFGQTLNFRNTSLRTGYSIAGILDVGLIAGLSFETINSMPSTAADFELELAALVLKESATVPFSLQLRGNYGYTRFVESEYLDATYLRRTGKGFDVGLSATKSFGFRGLGRLIVELSGGVRSYYFLTESTIPEVEFMLGQDMNRTYLRLFTSLPFADPDGNKFIPGLKAEYDLDGKFNFGPVISILIADGGS